MNEPSLAFGPHGVTFEIRVVPNAPRCAIVVEPDGRVKVRVDAPPVEGEANDRLVRFLAREVFKVPRASVRLLQGERGRRKVVAVDLPLAQVRAALVAAAG